MPFILHFFQTNSIDLYKHKIHLKLNLFVMNKIRKRTQIKTALKSGRKVSRKLDGKITTLAKLQVVARLKPMHIFQFFGLLVIFKPILSLAFDLFYLSSLGTFSRDASLIAANSKFLMSQYDFHF